MITRRTGVNQVEPRRLLTSSVRGLSASSYEIGGATDEELLLGNNVMPPLATENVTR